jgi:uncharacterized membrane protein
MEGVEKLLVTWQLHPVADHFTIALLAVAVLIDLVASVFPSRLWMRATALTLMILGALAAGASYATGDMEADRVWDMMSPAAQQYFKGSPHFLGHGALGYYLTIVFAGLAVWRILTAFNFMAGTRGLYLLVAFVSLGFLFYQGHTGGELVYLYGVGTGAMAANALPTAQPTAQVPATPIPTVYVPEPVATPAPIVTPAPAPSAAATIAPAAPAAPATPSVVATPAHPGASL